VLAGSFIQAGVAWAVYCNFISRSETGNEDFVFQFPATESSCAQAAV
jgi:hypothetical protein